ncbi:hypothetical protein D3C81_1661730 [compost metagenome]|uniref:hypothetical protein n=1 Tax=Pseudomonas moorei TaxID=395599 RepID=UPI000FA7D627
MQTNRTDFEAGFALLGLNPSPGAAYQGAHSYARQFKKCSILTEASVGYAATSAGSSAKVISKK